MAPPDKNGHHRHQNYSNDHPNYYSKHHSAMATTPNTNTARTRSPSILVAVRVRPLTKQEENQSLNTNLNINNSNANINSYTNSNSNSNSNINPNPNTNTNTPMMTTVTPKNTSINVQTLDSDETWKTVHVIPEEQLIVLHDPRVKINEHQHDPLVRSRECSFKFDQTFDVYHSQKQVFAETCETVVEKVIRGKHGCIFAYGATGSGKTYTMAGVSGKPGLIYLTIEKLFRCIRESENDDLKVTASYLEIYNETLRDLLAGPGGSSVDQNGRVIDLREDPIRGVVVSGVTEWDMQSEHDVWRILKQGDQNRTTDSHKLNERSSRSHAVLQIALEQTASDGHLINSTLNLIDLAGSERAKKVDSNKKMRNEGANINRSLLALANCINALGTGKKGLHIPYRDSKLTRILKDSIGGSAHTVMIANISCSATQFDETRETLLYANRAKNMKVGDDVLKNRVPEKPSKVIYEKMVNDLRAELKQLKSTLRRTSSIRPSLAGNIDAVPVTNSIEHNVMDDVPQTERASERISSQFLATKQMMKEIMSNFQDQAQVRCSLVELKDTIIDNQNCLAYIEGRLSELGYLSSIDLSTTDWYARRRSLDDSNRKVSNSIHNFVAVGDCNSSDQEETINSLLNEYRNYKHALRENITHQNELEELLEILHEQARQLRERASNGEDISNWEQQQLIYMTLERCEAELLKTISELHMMSLQATVESKTNEAQYYQHLLEQHGISFEPFRKPFDASQSKKLSRPTSQHFALPLSPSSTEALNALRNRFDDVHSPVAGIISVTRTTSDCSESSNAKSNIASPLSLTSKNHSFINDNEKMAITVNANSNGTSTLQDPLSTSSKLLPKQSNFSHDSSNERIQPQHIFLPLRHAVNSDSSQTGKPCVHLPDNSAAPAPDENAVRLNGIKPSVSHSALPPLRGLQNRKPAAFSSSSNGKLLKKAKSVSKQSKYFSLQDTSSFLKASRRYITSNPKKSQPHPHQLKRLDDRLLLHNVPRPKSETA